RGRGSPDRVGRGGRRLGALLRRLLRDRPGLEEVERLRLALRGLRLHLLEQRVEARGGDRSLVRTHGRAGEVGLEVEEEQLRRLPDDGGGGGLIVDAGQL